MRTPPGRPRAKRPRAAREAQSVYRNGGFESCPAWATSPEPQGRARSTLGAVPPTRKRPLLGAFGALSDGAQPGVADQRAAGVDDSPVAGKGAPGAVVGGRDAGLGGQQRARADPLDLEVEGRLGKPRLGEPAELGRGDAAQAAGRLPEAADAAEDELARRSSCSITNPLLRKPSSSGPRTGTRRPRSRAGSERMAIRPTRTGTSQAVRARIASMTATGDALVATE